MICPKCGTEHDSTTLCPGQVAYAGYGTEGQVYLPKKKINKKEMLIIGVLAVVVLTMFIVFMVGGRRPDSILRGQWVSENPYETSYTACIKFSRNKKVLYFIKDNPETGVNGTWTSEKYDGGYVIVLYYPDTGYNVTYHLRRRGLEYVLIPLDSNFQETTRAVYRKGK